MMKSIINFFTWPWRRYKENQEYKRRLKELREKDPFIYK